jgi:hypothetical protein
MLDGLHKARRCARCGTRQHAAPFAVRGVFAWDYDLGPGVSFLASQPLGFFESAFHASDRPACTYVDKDSFLISAGLLRKSAFTDLSLNHGLLSKGIYN